MTNWFTVSTPQHYSIAVVILSLYKLTAVFELKTDFKLEKLLDGRGRYNDATYPNL